MIVPALFVLSCSLFITVDGQSCRNRHSNCYYWSLAGYCLDVMHARTMATVCPEACNLCTPLGVMMHRRELACTDQDSNCPSYKDAGYCDHFRDWMRTNCQRSCGLCPTQAPATVCQDSNSYCSTWKKYCVQTSIYWPYMSKNCKKTCSLCTDGGTGGTGGGTGGTKGKKEYQCDFETDFCDWANQPIDDAANWAIGVASGGPSSGANGSANYAYVDSTVNNYNAKLILPWELVLPLDQTYIGSMCLHFSFQTGNGGSIKIIEDIYPTTNNKSPGRNVKGTLSGSGTWVNGKVLVQVDDKRQLSIDGKVGTSGRVVVDNLYFVKGRC